MLDPKARINNYAGLQCTGSRLVQLVLLTLHLAQFRQLCCAEHAFARTRLQAFPKRGEVRMRSSLGCPNVACSSAAAVSGAMRARLRLVGW